MPVIDAKTIFYMLFLGNLFSVLLIGIYLSARNVAHQIVLERIFAGAKLLQGGGWLLICLRNSIPDFVSMNLANSLLLIGFALDSACLASLSSLDPRKIGRTLAAITGALVLIRLLAFESLPMHIRTGLMSLVTAMFYGVPAWSLIRRSTQRNGRLSLFLGGCLSLFCAVFAGRALISFQQQNMTLFSSDITQLANFTALVGLMFVSTFGFMFIKLNLLVDLKTATLQGALRRMEDLAVTDSLTGLTNRREGDEIFAVEIDTVRRYGGSLSVILLDLDHFKQINDTHGHDAGDSVLRDVAHILRSSIRDPDIAARWGGEEFLVLAPHTSLPGACELAERIRANIAAHSFCIGQVTASLGVAQMAADDSREHLFKKADDALYAAKADGRNRVCRHHQDANTDGAFVA